MLFLDEDRVDENQVEDEDEDEDEQGTEMEEMKEWAAVVTKAGSGG